MFNCHLFDLNTHVVRLFLPINTIIWHYWKKRFAEIATPLTRRIVIESRFTLWISSWRAPSRLLFWKWLLAKNTYRFGVFCGLKFSKTALSHLLRRAIVQTLHVTNVITLLDELLVRWFNLICCQTIFTQISSSLLRLRLLTLIMIRSELLRLLLSKTLLRSRDEGWLKAGILKIWSWINLFNFEDRGGYFQQISLLCVKTCLLLQTILFVLRVELCLLVTHIWLISSQTWRTLNWLLLTSRLVLISKFIQRIC